MLECKTNTKLKEVAITMGENIAQKACLMRRKKETNEKWAEKVESACEGILRSVLTSFTKQHSYEITLITIPYIKKSVERGRGIDKIKREKIGNGSKKFICLCDVVDGTWNVKSGLGFTVSTLLAFTGELKETPEILRIRDFCIGVVAPHRGEGIYYGVKGSRPKFRQYDGNEESLRLSSETNHKHTRCIIDIFTAQNQIIHKKAVGAVVPVMKEWADFGRYYGTGIELMSLVGRSNTKPSYSGYISVQQKIDNLIAPLIILNGLGAEVSDWSGHSILQKPLCERVNIAIASNKALHKTLLVHLRNIY